MPDQPKFRIAKFDKALHDRSAFSCGIKEIDNWLKTSVSDQIKNNRVRLWCAINEEGQVIGFYSLNTQSVRPEKAGELARKGERHEIPALYLPCIAISEDYQEKGLGAALMGHAVSTALNISEQVGAAALILDVHKDEHYERRKAFYTRIGFAPLGGDKEERMYLSMKDARASQNKADKITKAA